MWLWLVYRAQLTRLIWIRMMNTYLQRSTGRRKPHRVLLLHSCSGCIRQVFHHYVGSIVQSRKMAYKLIAQPKSTVWKYSYEVAQLWLAAKIKLTLLIDVDPIKITAQIQVYKWYTKTHASNTCASTKSPIEIAMVHLRAHQINNLFNEGLSYCSGNL